MSFEKYLTIRKKNENVSRNLVLEQKRLAQWRRNLKNVQILMILSYYKNYYVVEKNRYKCMRVKTTGPNLLRNSELQIIGKKKVVAKMKLNLLIIILKNL